MFKIHFLLDELTILLSIEYKPLDFKFSFYQEYLEADIHTANAWFKRLRLISETYWTSWKIKKTDRAQTKKIPFL